MLGQVYNSHDLEQLLSLFLNISMEYYDYFGYIMSILEFKNDLHKMILKGVRENYTLDYRTMKVGIEGIHYICDHLNYIPKLENIYLNRIFYITIIIIK